MEFTLKSGAKLVVSLSSFQDAHSLTKALLKSLKGTDVPESPMDMDVKDFFNALISVATSDEVEQHLFKCGERALYNGVKFNRDLFDDKNLGEQAREDFYEISIKIIEVNCRPFFKRTFSMLKPSVK